VVAVGFFKLMLEKVEEIGTVADGDCYSGGMLIELYSETCVDSLSGQIEKVEKLNI
jgi:hypothetical protein